ncbi:MAG: SDR family oxidoreductase [Microthrixaceae bacterium]|nr:SDR family oxidoreductase [Microthrixaceae bacterium]
MADQHVLVTGASGYIGGRLVPALLAAGHRVRCLARTPSKLDDVAWRDRVEVVAGDVTDPGAVRAALEGIDAAYYLVHSMGGTADFATQDRRAAEAFRDAAADADVGRIVYLGGLGDDEPGLSSHLDSRHEVGRLLADGPVPVTELRAAVIIGSGSASFEMLRNLVEVLPAMVTPKWVHTRCQPIAIRDMLHYLVAAIDEPDAAGRVLEVGGPDVLTYLDMMRVYAELAGLRRRLVVPVPVLTPRLSSLWVGLVTPLPSGLARPLVESLSAEVVVRDHAVDEVLPHACLAFRDAVALALQRVEDLEVSTRWSGADLPGRSPADPLPSDPEWAGGTMLADVQEAWSPAPPEAVFATVRGIGGGRGWYVANWLWALRGWLDILVGGIGLRRGRRHPDDLRVGDALDFWRVEAYEPPRLLRLRAEMRLPGEAWLEWRVVPDDESSSTAGATLHQRALFHPRGLWGRAYWYAVLPFHALIFGRLCDALAEAATANPSSSPSPSRAISRR